MVFMSIKAQTTKNDNYKPITRIYVVLYLSGSQVPGSMFHGWVDGWREVKLVLRIACSNLKVWWEGGRMDGWWMDSL